VERTKALKSVTYVLPFPFFRYHTIVLQVLLHFRNPPQHGIMFAPRGCCPSGALVRVSSLLTLQ